MTLQITHEWFPVAGCYYYALYEVARYKDGEEVWGGRELIKLFSTYWGARYGAWRHARNVGRNKGVVWEWTYNSPSTPLHRSFIRLAFWTIFLVTLGGGLLARALL